MNENNEKELCLNFDEYIRQGNLKRKRGPRLGA